MLIYDPLGLSLSLSLILKMDLSFIRIQHLLLDLFDFFLHLTLSLLYIIFPPSLSLSHPPPPSPPQNTPPAQLTLYFCNANIHVYPVINISQ